MHAADFAFLKHHKMCALPPQPHLPPHRARHDREPPQPVVAYAVPVRAHGCTAHVDPHQEVVLEEEHPHPLASTDATTSPVNQFSLSAVT
uniref:Uncharacterized protein n=1 Tax=Zea mays TaxID=4577 RepID=A0A804Q170_MAIZE